MVTMAEERGLSLGETALAYEVELLGMTELEAVDEMLRRYEVMEASIEAGLDDGRSDMLLLQPTAPQVFQAESAGAVAIGGIHTRAAARALAVMHCCNSRGVVCAAPTGGSAGTVPGVVVSLVEEFELSRRQTALALFAASAVGLIVARRATFAAELAGCQVEIGVSGAMAAAAVVEAVGGSARQAADAAAISLQNTPTLSHSMRPSTHRMRWARPCPASFGVLPREVALSLRQRSVFHAFARCPASAGCLHRVLGWIFLCRRVLQGPRQCGSHGG
jgi:L-serine dehydratase